MRDVSAWLRGWRDPQRESWVRSGQAPIPRGPSIDDGLTVPSSRPLQLHFDPAGALLEAARACEADVFLRWFGNTREQLDDEYAPYDDASVFIALAREDGDVIGACRLIVPSPAGLKTLNDVGREPWRLDGERSARAAGVDPANTWDVATLGVRPGLGGAGMLAAAALYHGLIVASRVNRIQSIVIMIDEQVRTLLTSIAMTTHALPGASSAPYLGSPATTPVYGHCAQMLDTQRQQNPDAHRLIAQGVGLDGVTPIDSAAFVLHRRPRVVTLPRRIDLPDPARESTRASSRTEWTG